MMAVKAVGGAAMTARAKACAAALAIAAGAAILLARPGRTAAETASFKREYCYVANNSPASISILAVDPASGALTKLGQTPVGAKSQRLGALGLHPSSRVLYVADSDQTGSRVLTFAIDQESGALARTSNPPVPVSPAPLAAVVDHRGRFLYVASQSPRAAHASLSAFAIDAHSGQLAPVVGSPFGAGFCARDLALDPSDRFLFLAGCSVFGKLGTMPAMLGFRIDGSGALSPAGSAPFGVGTSDTSQTPTGVAVDAAGKWVFAADALGGSVWVFDISAKAGSEVLTPTPRSPFLVGAPEMDNRPSSVALDAANRALYATSMPAKPGNPPRAGAVSAFGIDAAAGTLKPLAGSPYKAGRSPVAAAVDPSGTFLYVLDRDDAAVSAYRIAGDGTLTAVAGSPFSIGGTGKSAAQPVGLAVAGIR